MCTSRINAEMKAGGEVVEMWGVPQDDRSCLSVSLSSKVLEEAKESKH